jgi:tetratricopeptide (TPR) repeat protein/predicted Ser/Thr protein kinase
MLQPGSQIGRYEIQRRLGRGGMGTVYVAHDPVLGRMVAVKVFATDLDLPDAAQRFTREARSAAALNHSNIVTVHDYGDVDSQPFIVMEYVQGETLADIIRRKAPVALTEKLRWVEELCAGASYAHRSGVLHRDIKPTNLMINRGGQLKILDFGIARMMGTLSPKATALVGTPGYMAPEQILGEGLDHRADLFSIGVVCYELLTYTEAFPGETLPTITHRILTQEPAPMRNLVPELHPELVAIVERSLRKNPAERFDDVEALRIAVARVRRQLENEAPWDALAPTIIVERPGAGGGKRGTGSQRQAVSDAVAVGQLTPPPESQRIDRDALARRRTEQIEAHLARSRTLVDTGELEAALQACAEALTLEETHPGALELEQSIEALMAARRAEALRQEAANELGRRALTSAQDLLQQARELDPDNADLKRLERDLRLARVEATRQRQRAEALTAALDRAERALEDRQTEAALAAARDALALDADSARARELEAEAMRRLDEETSHPTPAPGLGSAGATPLPGDLDLPPTVLSTRAAVLRTADAGVGDAAPTIIATPARRTPAPAEVRTRTPVPADLTAVRPPAPLTPTVRMPPAAEAKEKTPPTVEAKAKAKSPAPVVKKPLSPPQPRRDYLGEARTFLSRSIAPARAAWLARPKKERTIIALTAAGVAAAVLIGAAVLMRPPAVIPTGAVSIDAMPWATVTRIEAADGTEQTIPTAATTPLLLSLPIGTYRVTLTGPPPDLESRVVTFEVQADGTATAVPERFRTMTADEYFEQYLASSASSPADGSVPAEGDVPAANPAASAAGGSAGPSPAPQGARQ